MNGTTQIQAGTVDQKVNILLVDDQPANLVALEAILDDLGQNLVKATSGEDALRRLLEADFAAVLLDVQMHGLDGFETAKHIRGRERSRHTPIIFITAYESDQFPVEQAYSLGAVDYLMKPLVPIILRAKVAGFVDVYQKAARLRQLERREFEQKLADEEQRAQKALRESKARKTAILNTAPDCIITIDHQGNIVEFNPTAERTFGYERTAVLGRPMGELIVPPSLRKQHYEGMARFLATGEGPILGNRIEIMAMRADGAEFPVELAVTRIPTEGEPMFTAFVRDITSRIQAEEQTRFQAHLLDAVEQAAVATDPLGTIIYWNRFAEILYGWSKEEVIGRNIMKTLVAPSAVHQATEIMRRLRAGEGWHGESLVRHRDGRVFPIFVTDTPIFDLQGKLQAIIGISVDITKQKQVEGTLRLLAEASDTLATVVDFESTLQKIVALSVPPFADWCVVHVTEPDGSLRNVAVAHVNPAKLKMAEQLAKRHVDNPTVSRGPQQVLRTGQSELVEHVSDSFLVELAQDPELLQMLRDTQIESYICVPLRIRDKLFGVLTFVTSESKRRYNQSDLPLAEELARRAAIAIENCKLYADLREADRRKDEFLAMLAHELRNPLAPIRNALHVLKMPRADRSVLDGMRDLAERQVQHMARLLDDLLDVSRISRGRIELRIELVDLTAIINRAIDAARAAIDDRRHRLEISVPATGLQVQGDPTRLEQVFTNLLNNAAKYMDPGGQIRVLAERQADQIMIRVRDTGIGIAPEMVPYIFDLFVQAPRQLDRSQGGVGIGLTLVRKLVELHSGKVEVVSAGLGKGSEFIVTLPAAIAAAEVVRQPRAEPHQPNATHSRRVLVVDDNQDAADSLAMLLKLSGQQVSTAYSGAAALETALSQRPEMIFLDIGMPGMDGYEVARRVRQEPGLEGVRLIALTGWGQEEDRQRTTAAGFNHHLVKPVEPAALTDLLANKSRS